MSKILIHNFGGLFLESGTQKRSGESKTSAAKKRSGDGQTDPAAKKEKRDENYFSDEQLEKELEGIEKLLKEYETEFGGLFYPVNMQGEELSEAMYEEFYKDIYVKRLPDKDLDRPEGELKDLQDEKIIDVMIKKIQNACGVEGADKMHLVETKVPRLKLTLGFNSILALLYLEINNIEGAQEKAKNIKNVFNEFANFLKIKQIQENIVELAEIKETIITKSLNAPFEFILSDNKLRIQNTKIKKHVLHADVDSSKLVQFCISKSFFWIKF